MRFRRAAICLAGVSLLVFAGAPAWAVPKDGFSLSVLDGEAPVRPARPRARVAAPDAPVRVAADAP
ncbi:MAG: hypothetical protein JWR08_2353, partial [Enterovirga sp.]|nr:hypothetical protein [Enterovirga sp.]